MNEQGPGTIIMGVAQLTGGVVGDVRALRAESVEDGTGRVDVAHGQQVVSGALSGETHAMPGKN